MFWAKWSWTTRVQCVLAVLAIVYLGLVAPPLFQKAKQNRQRSSCQSNLKQVGLGFMQYLRDYDEKFPLAQGQGWAHLVQPYLRSTRKSTQIFQCPTEGIWPDTEPNPKLTGYTDYFFNRRLNARKESAFDDLPHLILAAEGNDGKENTSASYAKTEIPPPWRTDFTSPAFRHLKFANYLFADAHAKALKVEKISTAWSADKYYFQPKSRKKTGAK